MQGDGYSNVLTIFVCVAMLRMGERVGGCGLWVVVCLGCMLVFPGRLVQRELIERSDVEAGGECLVTCGILL